MREKDFNRPLLIASVILTIVLIFVGLIAKSEAASIPEPGGTVLTVSFMENYCDAKALKGIGNTCLFSALFTGGAIFIALIWYYSGKPFATKVFVTICMFMGPVLILGTSLPKNIAILVKEPRVETVYVTGRHSRFAKRHSVYKFVFSNGKEDTVSYDEYKNVPDKTEYFMVMCGNECADTFVPGEYTLR